MAKNRVRPDGYHLSVVCSHPAAPGSGDPIRYGALTGVALVDEGDGGNAATETTVDFGAVVWDLVVDDNEGTGIAVGDAIYYHDTGTGTGTTSLNNSATSMDAYFGVALEAISANGTERINVLHVPIGASLAVASTSVGTGQLADDAVTSAKMDAGLLRSSTTNLTSAQIKALKATPITLVDAPGADLAVVPVSIALVVNYGGTNAFTETADDLSIGYSGGAEIKEIESTGLIDQTNDEWRYITFEFDETFQPTENTAVEITNLDDEIAGNAAGNNTARVVLTYRVVPTDL